MIRKHIIAHGRVQGVGLRFTVTGFAKKYNVTGWVRNLYDGTVEMEVQGLDHRVELFLPVSYTHLQIHQVDFLLRQRKYGILMQSQLW